MTNAEKFTTAKERAKALFKWKERKYGLCCVNSKRCAEEMFTWLDLEADVEEPLPCPFCGGSCSVHILGSGNPAVLCDNDDCFYHAMLANTREEAIAAHNRVARAAKEKEAK